MHPVFCAFAKKSPAEATLLKLGEPLVLIAIGVDPRINLTPQFDVALPYRETITKILLLVLVGVIVAVIFGMSAKVVLLRLF